jgi:hypothetical protein
MPNYMLLLYTPTYDRPSPDDPGMDVSRWVEFQRNLEEAGVFLATGRLHPADTATTVRVRNDETLITDGPFADTKEYFAGYYLLDCPDLDSALEFAARVPHIHYGTVEVRPVMDVPPLRSGEAQAQAQA